MRAVGCLFAGVRRSNPKSALSWSIFILSLFCYIEDAVIVKFPPNTFHECNSNIPLPSRLMRTVMLLIAQ
ncbi:hypothetical protein V2G26_004813 [Clonostachys chloroleuca]